MHNNKYRTQQAAARTAQVQNDVPSLLFCIGFLKNIVNIDSFFSSGSDRKSEKKPKGLHIGFKTGNDDF